MEGHVVLIVASCGAKAGISHLPLRIVVAGSSRYHSQFAHQALALKAKRK